MLTIPAIDELLLELNKVEIKQILEDSRRTHMPPKAGTEDEIAAVGLGLVNTCRVKKCELFQVAIGLGIRGRFNSGNIYECSDAAMETYLVPFLNYILQRLPDEPQQNESVASPPVLPAAIQESIVKFQADFPDPRKVGFIIMRFGGTTAHEGIETAIKEGLKKQGLVGVLARDKEYHDELYPNIQTYMHGCGFGIAIFERIERDDFNPNVSLEVGYMLGLKKPVLLLKDKTLPALHSDLVGHLYRAFDILHPEKTIPSLMTQWLEDRSLI